MIERIYEFISKNRMFDSCEHIVAGISGGADSVCLLYVLCEIIKRYNLAIKITAVHVNHGIRGDEALRDEEFTKNLCKKLNVECVTRRVDVPVIAKQNKMSEEDAGRMVRYSVFREVAENYPAAKIAVAHHINDQAETVLMNIVRGSGLTGLRGIKPCNDEIIRPLLCITKEEIKNYLKQQNQEYITDSTNLDNEYTRNRLRNVLIPYIKKELNPDFENCLINLSENVSEAEEYIKKQADILYAECVRESDFFDNILISTKEPSEFVSSDAVLRKYVIRKALCKILGTSKDIYKNHIDMIDALAKMQVGKQVCISKNVTAKRTYDGVKICRQKDSASKERLQLHRAVDVGAIGDNEEFVVEINREIYIPDKGYEFVADVTFEKLSNTSRFENNDYTKYFDCDNIKGNLVIRFRQNGDRIIIDESGNSKKIKKEFIDRKIPDENRDDVLLFEKNGYVYWAVGVRQSSDCRVNKYTKNVLKITINIREGNSSVI